MNSILNSKGYKVDFHDANHDESHNEGHASHGFEWEAHIESNHEGEHVNHGHHEDISASIVEMIDSGEISFFDTHYRRFWSNLLVNEFDPLFLNFFLFIFIYLF